METLLVIAFIIGGFYIIYNEKKKCTKDVDHSRNSL